MFNNFLDVEDIEKCKKIINDGKWSFGQRSNSNDKNKLSTQFFYMELEDNEFFRIYLKEKIETKLGMKFILDRVYANGQTFGLDGCYHQDNTESGTFTFCLYITPVPKELIEEVGGNILFKIPSIEHFTLGLEPLYNRAVYFPSTFFHKGTSFNRFIKNMRISIAWKFRLHN